MFKYKQITSRIKKSLSTAPLRSFSSEQKLETKETNLLAASLITFALFCYINDNKKLNQAKIRYLEAKASLATRKTYLAQEQEKLTNLQFKQLEDQMNLKNNNPPSSNSKPK